MQPRTLSDQLVLRGEKNPTRIAFLVRKAFREKHGRYPNLIEGLEEFDRHPVLYRTTAEVNVK